MSVSFTELQVSCYFKKKRKRKKQVSWWVAAITHIWEYEPGNMKHCDKFWIDGGREWTGIGAVMVVVHSEIMALDE